MRQLEALNSQIEFQSAHVTLIRYLASSDKTATLANRWSPLEMRSCFCLSLSEIKDHSDITKIFK